MKWAIVNKKESNVTIENKNTIAKFCIEFLINTKKRGIQCPVYNHLLKKVTACSSMLQLSLKIGFCILISRYGHSMSVASHRHMCIHITSKYNVNVPMEAFRRYIFIKKNVSLKQYVQNVTDLFISAPSLSFQLYINKVTSFQKRGRSPKN